MGEEKLDESLPLPMSFEVWLKDTDMSITRAPACLQCARGILVMGRGPRRERFTDSKGPDLCSGKAPSQLTGTSGRSHEARREKSEVSGLPYQHLPYQYPPSGLVAPLETPLAKQRRAGY